MSDDIIGGRYQIVGGPVAVQWNEELAKQFPKAEHYGCRILYHIDGSGHWRPLEPTACVGYHCPHCGEACGYTGHTECTDDTTNTPGKKEQR